MKAVVLEDITAMLVLKDGTFLTGGGYRIQRWNINNLSSIQLFPLQSPLIFMLEADRGPWILFSIGADGNIETWDIWKGVRLRQVTCNLVPRSVLLLKESDNSRAASQLLIGTDDKMVLWNLVDGQNSRSIVCQSTVTAMSQITPPLTTPTTTTTSASSSLSATGIFILSASEDGILKLWDMKKFGVSTAPMKTFRTTPIKFHSIVEVEPGLVVATASSTTIVLWNIRDGTHSVHLFSMAIQHMEMMRFNQKKSNSHNSSSSRSCNNNSGNNNNNNNSRLCTVFSNSIAFWDTECMAENCYSQTLDDVEKVAILDTQTFVFSKKKQLRLLNIRDYNPSTPSTAGDPRELLRQRNSYWGQLLVSSPRAMELSGLNGHYKIKELIVLSNCDLLTVSYRDSVVNSKSIDWWSSQGRLITKIRVPHKPTQLKEVDHNRIAYVAWKESLVVIVNKFSQNVERAIYDKDHPSSIFISKRIPNMLYAASADGVNMWSIIQDTDHPIQRLVYNVKKQIMSLALFVIELIHGPDGEGGGVVCASQDYLTVWDSHTGISREITSYFGNPITQMFELSCGLLATSHPIRGCKLWDVHAINCVATIKPPGRVVFVFEPFVGFLVIGSTPRSLRVWDVKKHCCVGMNILAGKEKQFFDSQTVLAPNGALLTWESNGSPIQVHQTFHIQHNLVMRCCYVIAKTRLDLHSLKTILPQELFELCCSCRHALL
eukprot:TRINITY_DN3371_c0_g1_i3.p1 TRINITY_DN3371_c0_g1~~TRINITY_DN3371_c0_g1_i3.p1  ORF type:complete len:716 (+),score=110.36 TRINITY_DN3371_c0_g1_i3:86-2233(+)